MQSSSGPRRAKPPWRLAVLCESRTPKWAAEQIVQAAVNCLSQAGSLVRVVTPGKAQPKDAACLRWLRQLGVDGAISVEHGWVRRPNEARRVWQFPLVCAEALPAGVDADLVAIDEEAVATLALGHLSAVGHRRCGYLITLDRPHARNRFAKFAQEARARGMWDESLILDLRAHTAQTPLEVVDLNRPAAVKKFFAACPKPLAMFSHNDFVAAGLVEWLLEHGYRVPDEIAVVGVDNHLLYVHTNVPLTTVKLPLDEMGRQCARLLLERLHRRWTGPPRRIALSPTLIVRQSSIRTGPTNRWLQTALDHIQQHYHEPKAMRELRGKVGLARETLARRFHQAMGCTLLQYRDRLRLDHAGELLLSGPTAKIEAVAREVGYSSAGRFAAAFRQKFGMGPAGYRRQLGKS